MTRFSGNLITKVLDWIFFFIYKKQTLPIHRRGAVVHHLTVNAIVMGLIFTRWYNYILHCNNLNGKRIRAHYRKNLLVHGERSVLSLNT